MSQFVIDDINHEIRGENDGGDRTWGRYQLDEPPDGVKKISLGFRAYFNSYPDNDIGNTEAVAWNKAFFFGLGWDNTILSFPSATALWQPDGFFGVCTTGCVNTNGQNRTTSTSDLAAWCTASNVNWGTSPTRSMWMPSYTNAATGASRSVSLMNGVGGELFWSHGIDAASGATAADVLSLCFPANPTVGALWSCLWEIWLNDGDGVSARVAHSMASLSGEAMLDAASIGNVWVINSGSGITVNKGYTVHGAIASNFRPSSGVFTPPRWLKWAYPNLGQTLVLKDYYVRYYTEA